MPCPHVMSSRVYCFLPTQSAKPMMRPKTMSIVAVIHRLRKAPSM
ncbi:Uncharacterised protein [Mycobacteroides abscessus subsp. abscessus]|nr:Uncharacterised protein [Mycobacteroides abscessus subsp. abscessus]